MCDTHTDMGVKDKELQNEGRTARPHNDRFVERARFTTGSALLLFLFVPSVIKLVFHFHTSMGWEIEPFLFTVDVLSRGAFYDL